MADFDEEDEDVKCHSQVVPRPKHTISFSDLTINSLVNARMKLRLLKCKTMGEKSATELVNNSVSGAVTMEETKKSLRNIHKIVSMDVS